MSSTDFPTCAEVLLSVQEILVAYDAMIKLLDQFVYFEFPELIKQSTVHLENAFKNHQFVHVVDILVKVGDFFDKVPSSGGVPIPVCAIAKKFCNFLIFIGNDIVNLVRRQCKPPCPFASEVVFAEAQSLTMAFSCLNLSDPAPPYVHPPEYVQRQREMVWFDRQLAEIVAEFFKVIDQMPVSLPGIRDRDAQDFLLMMDLRDAALKAATGTCGQLRRSLFKKNCLMILKLMLWYGRPRPEEYYLHVCPKAVFPNYSFHYNCAACFSGLLHCRLNSDVP